MYHPKVNLFLSLKVHSTEETWEASSFSKEPVKEPVECLQNLCKQSLIKKSLDEITLLQCFSAARNKYKSSVKDGPENSPWGRVVS